VTVIVGIEQIGAVDQVKGHARVAKAAGGNEFAEPKGGCQCRGTG
jgi:hypothetical protein